MKTGLRVLLVTCALFGGLAYPMAALAIDDLEADPGHHKLEFENDQLKLQRANALRIKFETTDKEKSFLEAQLASGGKVDIVNRLRSDFNITRSFS